MHTYESDGASVNKKDAIILAWHKFLPKRNFRNIFDEFSGIVGDKPAKLAALIADRIAFNEKNRNQSVFLQGRYHCYMSLDQLAEKLHVNERTIRRSISILSDAGIMQKFRRGIHGKNWFSLVGIGDSECSKVIHQSGHFVQRAVDKMSRHSNIEKNTFNKKLTSLPLAPSPLIEDSVPAAKSGQQEGRGGNVLNPSKRVPDRNVYSKDRQTVHSQVSRPLNGNSTRGSSDREQFTVDFSRYVPPSVAFKALARVGLADGLPERKGTSDDWQYVPMEWKRRIEGLEGANFTIAQTIIGNHTIVCPKSILGANTRRIGIRGGSYADIAQQCREIEAKAPRLTIISNKNLAMCR